MPEFSTWHVNLFKSLFKGREDVFALRWEKDGKKGYVPAYNLDWNQYKLHKEAGGSLKDFKHKEYAKLTDEIIVNHLTGKEIIGLYPLLSDNTSWFIVADFDETAGSGKGWLEECRLFVGTCTMHKIPAYLERSRSGKGGHVWVFFDRNYPAEKSRKIILRLLEDASILSPFDKNSNYDRLFPNQDFHSGKGFGNLVALPLQKKALEQQNSSFINRDGNLVPDQWQFLQNIEKVGTQHLDEVYKDLFTTAAASDNSVIVDEMASSTALQINFNNEILILRNQLKPELVQFLRDSLNFINTDYVIKKRMGKTTYGSEPYFNMLEHRRDCIVLPRGFIGKLVRFCKEHNILYELKDERRKLSEVKFTFKGSLYDYQQQCLEVTEKKDIGIIVASPGSGKTIIALAIIAQKKQPALIIVHRKQLFDQWLERIEAFLGIAKPFIGRISSGHEKIGTHITVAMIQSIASFSNPEELFKSFGTIIVDECHHVPARTFREVVRNFQSYYFYGLTATPIRKNNDEKLIFLFIGYVIHQVKHTPGSTTPADKLAIVVRETALFVPFDYKTDTAEILSRILIHDTARNSLIAEDIKSEVTAGRKVLVLTERKAHIDVLSQYLRNRVEVIMISGEDNAASRSIKFKQIEAGHFQVLISTGQFIGEGVDMVNLDCLVLAYPFAFEGKLVQYIGRVQRNTLSPIIYDYRDVYIDYMEMLFRQRNRHYQKLLQTGQLTKYDELTLIFNEDKFYINSEANAFSISCLDLPIEAEKFKAGVVWRVRILNYDEITGLLTTEIVNYDADSRVTESAQSSLLFMQIEAIRFRTIDTTQLLRAIEIRKQLLQTINEHPMTYVPPKPAIPKVVFAPIDPIPEKLPEYVLVKTMKVPFDNLYFLNAEVSFSIFIEELAHEVKFTIVNPDIRAEFEVIKDYFKKVLKKKIIVTNIEIRYNKKELLSAHASSEDIDLINQNIIDNIRFEFVKRKIFTLRGKNENMPVVNTMDTLLTKGALTGGKLYQTEQHLIDDLLAIKKSKHYQHLQFLSSQHLSSVLKVRFILEPFSFLFLLAGETRYHIVWETLNSEEATYIWHFQKSIEALRTGLKEIEVILQEIKETNKQEYLKKEHHNFSRIIHDYTDPKKGFIQWKDSLEKKLL
jgi:superfamily II DNA or RNA helicase